MKKKYRGNEINQLCFSSKLFHTLFKRLSVHQSKFQTTARTFTGCTTNSSLLSTCPVVKKGKNLPTQSKKYLDPKNPTYNFSKDAGTKLKTAALAYPNKAVEISGPVRGNIRHAQYNTPCCMYSDAQIANTLISQAAAVGADVPDATAFGNDNIHYSLFHFLSILINSHKLMYNCRCLLVTLKGKANEFL